MRIAALDLGSNSFHLLVADVHPDGTFEAITREKEMLRLGDEVAWRRPYLAVVGRSGGCERAPAPPAGRRLGAQEVIAKATSAIRSAVNGSELVDRIEAETGVEVEVISGLEEARLIFAAVRASLVLEPAPALCVDIGGGSVEISIGDSGRAALGHQRPARRRPPDRRARAVRPSLARRPGRARGAYATSSRRSSTTCGAARR